MVSNFRGSERLEARSDVSFEILDRKTVTGQGEANRKRNVNLYKTGDQLQESMQTGNKDLE
jgi:hypothetical protein